MVAGTELQCAVVYRLNQQEQTLPTILACMEDFQDSIRFARAGAKVVRNIPPGKGPEKEEIKISGFRVVQSSDHHQLVYGIDQYGLCYCIISGDWYPPRIAIRFLVELASQFSPKFGSYAQDAREFFFTRHSKEIFHELCGKYKDPTKVDRVTKALHTAMEAKDKMEGNFDKLRSRMSTQLQRLMAKSETLEDMASVFKKKFKPKSTLVPIPERPTPVPAVDEDEDDTTCTDTTAGESCSTIFQDSFLHESSLTTAEEEQDSERSLEQYSDESNHPSTDNNDRFSVGGGDDQSTSGSECSLHFSDGENHPEKETTAMEVSSTNEHSSTFDNEQERCASASESSDGCESANHNLQPDGKEQLPIQPFVAESYTVLDSSDESSVPCLEPIDDDTNSISHSTTALSLDGNDSDGNASIDFGEVNDVSSHYLDDTSFGSYTFIPFPPMPDLFPYHVSSGASIHWHRLSGSTIATKRTEQALMDASLGSKSQFTSSSNKSEWSALGTHLRGLQDHRNHYSFGPQGLEIDVKDSQYNQQETSVGGLAQSAAQDTISRDQYEYLLKRLNDLTEDNQLLREGYMTLQERCSDLLYANSSKAKSKDREERGRARKDRSSHRRRSSRAGSSTRSSRSGRRHPNGGTERRKSSSLRPLREVPETENGTEVSLLVGSESEQKAVITLQCFWRICYAKKRTRRRRRRVNSHGCRSKKKIRPEQANSSSSDDRNRGNSQHGQGRSRRKERRPSTTKKSSAEEENARRRRRTLGSSQPIPKHERTDIRPAVAQ